MNDCFENSVIYFCHWDFVSSRFKFHCIITSKWTIISKVKSLISVTLTWSLLCSHLSILHRTSEQLFPRWSHLFLSLWLSISSIFSLVYIRTKNEWVFSKFSYLFLLLRFGLLHFNIYISYKQQMNDC